LLHCKVKVTTEEFLRRTGKYRCTGELGSSICTVSHCWPHIANVRIATA